jgi:hypothetical protein
MDATTFWRAELLPCVTLEHQCRPEIGFDWKRQLFRHKPKGAAEMLMEEQVHPEQLHDYLLKAVLLPDLMKWKCMV